MKLRPPACSVLLVLGLLVASAAPAGASHIAGIRITPVYVSGPTVRVDITVFYDTAATQTTARLGKNPGPNPSGIDNHAIDWGLFPEPLVSRIEGLPLVSTNTVVNGIPVRAYKGSFVHTYGSVGTHQITTATNSEESFETPFASGNLDAHYSNCGTTCVRYFFWATNTTVVEVTEPPVFLDGFETGDFSAWSATNRSP